VGVLVEGWGLFGDAFDENIWGVLRGIDGTLQGFVYFQGDKVAGYMAGLANDGGCSMSLLFHNIQSAKGANLELLEAEMRMWAVPWDVVGLAETCFFSERNNIKQSKTTN
jgi:hypothetical protein